MRAHVIQDGRVVNTIEVDSLEFMPNLIPAHDGGIGWSVVDGTLRPPLDHEMPTPVPKAVTRRQGLQALFKKHRLTEQMVADKIIEMVADPDEQYLALTEFKTSQTFERNRPLVLVMGAALGLDLDELFIYAATL